MVNGCDKSWRPILLLVAIAFIIRCFGIDEVVLTFDESFSWRMTTYSFRNLLQHLPRDGHPPLHYLLWKAWAAIAGTSVIALRGLSVVFGTLAVVLLARLVHDANIPPASKNRTATPRVSEDRAPDSVCLAHATGGYREDLSGQRNQPQGGGGMLLAILLTALHPWQVQAGATVRMYSLGVLLAVLTAWLLLCALRAEEGFSPWWSAYAVATAAFTYTHYFAFFTVLAQTLFVVCFLVARSRAAAWRQIVPSALGFVYAAVVAVLLYAPWLPVFTAQANDVHEGWWVAAPTAQSVERSLFTWLTGMPYDNPLVARGLLTLFGSVLLWTLWRGGGPAWFFFLQAAVPWVAALVFSLYGGQSLFQDRYFVFAQVGLYGVWSITWWLLPGWPERLLLASVLVALCGYGLVDHLGRLPDSPPAHVAAAQWLREQYQEDDLFLVEDHREINRFRYYTTQAGLPWLTIKAQLSPFRKGHVVHLASLEGQEIYWTEEDLWPRAPRRVWRESVSLLWPRIAVPDRKLTVNRTFTGGGGTTITLVGFEP